MSKVWRSEMGDVIKLENNIPANVDNGQDLVEYTEGMLEDARAAIDAKKHSAFRLQNLPHLVQAYHH